MSLDVPLKFSIGFIISEDQFLVSKIHNDLVGNVDLLKSQHEIVRRLPLHTLEVGYVLVPLIMLEERDTDDIMHQVLEIVLQIPPSPSFSCVGSQQVLTAALQTHFRQEQYTLKANYSSQCICLYTPYKSTNLQVVDLPL